MIRGYLSCNREVRKKNKMRAERKREKKGKRKVFQRLALTEEGESCWETLAAIRAGRRGGDILTGRKPEVRGSH